MWFSETSPARCEGRRSIELLPEAVRIPTQKPHQPTMELRQSSAPKRRQSAILKVRNAAAAKKRSKKVAPRMHREEETAMRKLLLVLAALGAACFSAALYAEDYPLRPVTIELSIL